MRHYTSRALQLVVALALAGVIGCGTIEGPTPENLPPETEIVAPTDPSGTLTVADGTAIVLRWRSVDPEEQAGEPGGVAAMEILLDGGTPVIFDCPPDSAEWWFSSSAESGGTHYISSSNYPMGGNRQHRFRVRAQDVTGCWEAETDAASYLFRYNYPPSSEIVSPQPGEVVSSSFTIVWRGMDVDGEVSEYQYVLDPALNPYQVTNDTTVSYSGVTPGEHEFRLRAKDSSGCWETEYRFLGIEVE